MTVTRETSGLEATGPTKSPTRAMASLFVSVAAMSTSMAGTSTVGTLIASDAVGKGWSGVTAAFGIVGTAIGSVALGSFMANRGRRAGLIIGYAIAALGAVIAAVAVLNDAFVVLLVGLVGIGVGNAGGQLARYAAADLYGPERRGTALGIVVWAGTVGAVLGPSLIAPAATVAKAMRLPELSGSFLLAVGLTALAGLSALLLPRPRSSSYGENTSEQTERIGITRLLARPTVRLALAAMVCGQVTMVAVMTMTPVHLHSHGHGLGTVGGILTAHMVGMFALAPLSGKLADRFGGTRVIVGGVGTLVIATVLAAGAPLSIAGLPVALFLLGYGWNLCFVGGSSLLAKDLPPQQRTRLQGTIDGTVWATAAIAGLASGQLLALGDYSFLAALSGLVALLPVVFMLSKSR